MQLGFTLAPAADFSEILQQIKRAEAAACDFVWLSEGMTLSSTGRDAGAGHEATLLASALSTLTTHIGLLVTAAPARHEPYNLARRLVSLDWISHGRVGWVVDSGAEAEREDEYVRLVGDLWDSWDDDAFIYDKAAGRFFTPEKMHVLNHAGPHFSVRGPLNVNRSPQGRPIVAALAGTPAARTAEIVFLREGDSDPDLQEGRAGSTRRLKGWSDFRGSPVSQADSLQHAQNAAGLDGFVLAPSSAAELEGFIDGVVPELARRGLIGGPQATVTLRDRLGLPRPALPANQEVSA